jgi:hypothetical protein
MAHFYSHDDSVLGYGEAADEDVRVLRQIEERGRELQRQMDRLEARWYKRLQKFEKNTGQEWDGNFKDNLC